MSLCAYKNLLGEPGKGLHSIRLFNIAVVDVLGAVLLAYLFTKIPFKKRLPFWLAFVIVMIIAILAHLIFCVNTTLGVLIFGEI